MKTDRGSQLRTRKESNSSAPEAPEGRVKIVPNRAGYQGQLQSYEPARTDSAMQD